MIEKSQILKELASYLSKEKDKKGYTLDDIAKRTGKSKVTASKILRGEYKVTIDTVRDFAEIGLGIPPSTFDAKVQEITRQLVGVDTSESDPYSLLLRDHGLPDSARADIEFALEFIKNKYGK